jgi:hypothetical protein
VGRIRRIFETRTLEEPILNQRFTVELCENVHLHYRNLRLEFPKEEFLRLLHHLKGLDETRIERFDYGHGRFETLVEDRGLPPATEFNQRLQVEEQVEGHFHVHFRNLRLELRALGELAVRPPLALAPTYGVTRLFRRGGAWYRRLRGAASRRLRPVVQLLRRATTPALRLPPGLGVDPGFFDRYLRRNPAVRCAQRRMIRLSELCAHIRNGGVDTFLPVWETPAGRYLVGDKPGYEAYHQHENTFNVHSAVAYDALIESMTRRSYEPSLSAIVIFEGEPVIRDGQHRAAILYHLHGDMEIPVIDVRFTSYEAYASLVGASTLPQRGA